MSFSENIQIAESYYKNSDYFNAIIYYKKGLFLMPDKNERQALQDLVDKIEYKGYSSEAIKEMRKHKNQIAAYVEKQLNTTDILKINDFVTCKNPIHGGKLKIVFGSMEIAANMYLYVKQLRQMQYQAFSINYYSSYVHSKNDYEIKSGQYSQETLKEKLTPFVSYVISEFDIFHFFFNTSLMLDHSDLLPLKVLGKKMVMYNVGSDVRQYKKAIELNSYWELLKETYFKRLNDCRTEEQTKYMASWIDSCIAGDGELREYVKPYYKNLFTHRVPIDLEQHQPTQTKNSLLKIAHAPTNPEGKGTKYIAETIIKLKKHYNFDFVLIQGTERSEAKKILESSDIVIDQIIAGGYGNLAIESMAMAKTVLCWISPFMQSKYPKELPIISANKDNLYEKLEWLMLHSEELPKIGAAGRKYVEKYHDLKEIGKELISIYHKLN